ncbi:MAG: nucleotidyltransferase family protein [Alphaproteobacteria bacterium]
MRKLDEIIDQLRQLQPALRRRYPIRQMGVFGSYVRGEQTEESDLDVLVEMGDGIGLIEFVGLQQHLSDALGVNVELVMKDALKPELGRRIMSEVVML